MEGPTMAVEVNDNKPANFDELEPKQQMDVLGITA
jgi:hypothetical protein